MVARRTFDLLIIALFFLFAASACVSVNIGPDKGARSSGVNYTAPKEPFKEIDSARADSAWKSEKTGSTIAFQSSCGEAADVALEAAADELFQGFDQKSVINEQRKSFDGREALDAEREGRIDGVDTRIRALIYKKNKCTYVITFVGLPKGFEADRPVFEDFIASFRAP